jgi:hypothetical protein
MTSKQFREIQSAVQRNSIVKVVHKKSLSSNSRVTYDAETPAAFAISSSISRSVLRSIPEAAV